MSIHANGPDRSQAQPPVSKLEPGVIRKATDLLGMIKFSHTLFALPFAVLGGLLAAKTPTGWHSRSIDWLGILLAMASARSAAMAFNRIVDRGIDAKNPRTANRHIPSGAISVASASAFTILMGILFVCSTLLFWPNRLPLMLSVPVLAWLLGYSYAKRFTWLAHFWLGSSLMLAPIAAWIALRGSLGWPPVYLGLAVLWWVSGFDILYACQDIDFDRAHSLKSVPSRFGIGASLRVAALFHLMMLFALVALARSYPMGLLFMIGTALVAVALVHEHSLVSARDLSKVNIAFFQVNVAIGLVLLAFGAADLAYPVRLFR